MLLELSGIKVNYGSAQVLQGISICIEENSIVCLIGANGAGKTTTLRTVSGLKQPISGEIRFEKRDILGMRPLSILGLGIAQVPQEGKIFRDMTVYENLMMGAYLRNDKKKIKDDLSMIYDYFPILKPRSKQAGGKLSGGERQMLSIARAMMSNPKLLMMDEPSAGLAPMVVVKVGDIISRLNGDGLSILLVEQNADFSLKTATYGYVLERGKIVLSGKTKDLLSNDVVREAYLGM